MIFLFYKIKKALLVDFLIFLWIMSVFMEDENQMKNQTELFLIISTFYKI